MSSAGDVRVLDLEDTSTLAQAYAVECEATRQTRPGGVRRLVAHAYRPTAADLEALATGFAGPVGYAVATTETVVELDLVGADLSPPRPPDGCVDSTYLDGVPDRLRLAAEAVQVRDRGAQRPLK